MATIRYRVPSVSIVGTTAPAWFSALAERTWTDVAGGAAYSGAAWQKGNRLRDVLPSPLPTPGDPNRFITAYAGKVALQGRREYLNVVQPGHADYTGNDIYALALGDETPAWKRIWGPTPAASRSTASYSYNAPKIAHNDGAPRSCHGWFTRLATEGPQGDRLWTLLTNEQGSGVWTSDVWSIPRASLDVGVIDPSLWVYHGRLWADATGIGTEFLNQSFPACWDSLANRIWTSPEADVRPTGTGVLVRTIDVATCLAAGAQSAAGPQVPGSTTYLATAGSPASGFAQAWSVVTTNTSPRCVIALRSGQIAVWNLESPTAWRNKTVTGGSLPGAGSANAYYSAANGKIVLGGATMSTLQTITVPADPWNASSGFALGSIATAGGSLSAIVGAGATNSQWQVIGNMGNGQACVVIHCRNVDSPTYVYKLPATF